MPPSTSKLDINAIPTHKPTGKPLTQVNIDTDLPAEQDKPWRKPGTDLSDYFNYGFDEFTWALYAQKQEALRAEYNPDAIAQSNKKMMEEMTSMMMMGGMGMPGPPPGAGAGGPAQAGGAVGAGGGPGAGAGGVVGQMPGMEGVTPEVQAMMQQMMANGMDPSQMDMGAMAAMYGGGGAGAGGPGQGGQGQGFGGGFGGGQGQGYGYEQQMGGGGGRGGRGRGRRW